MTAGSGVGRGWSRSLDDTASTDSMVPARSQTLLLGGRLHPPCLWGGGRAGYTTHLTAFDKRPLSKRRLGLFPFRTAPLVGCVVSSTAAALKLLL